MRIFVGILLTAICGAVLAAGPVWAEADPPIPAVESTEAPSSEEHWYRVEIGGEPAGFLVERSSSSEGLVRSESRFQIELRRAGNRQQLEIESGFVETADGVPVRSWSRQRLGQQPVETTYEFNPDHVLVRHQVGTETREERLPAPPSDWLTPAQEAEALRRRLASGEEAFSEQSLDPLLGLEPIRTDWRREEEGVEIEAAGQTYLTDRWAQSQSIAPGLVSYSFLTREGLLVRSTSSLMGLNMVLELSTREAVEAAPAKAPELLTGTFVAPDRRLRNPRELRRAAFVLRPLSGELPALPEAGAQRIERREDHVRVHLEVGRSSAADPADSTDYLAPSAYADGSDPRVRALVEKADPGAEAGSARRAEALRRFVHGYLDSKDLSSLLATAGEAADSRSGDCTEHSVLLMAMLRAIGIPSRAATGLVYVREFAGAREVFGYHMWTQALIDGRWVDLDATLAKPFDAAHILFATSAFGDRGSALRDMAGMVGLMGNVRIEILEPRAGRGVPK